MSAFEGGIQNSQEITHEKYLAGSEELAQNFVRTMSLLGDRREFPSDHTHPKRDWTEDLTWWSERVDRFLSEGREVFAYANNHYENHSPSTLQRLLEIRHKSR